MSADESCADPSLPLQERSLAGGLLPLSRSVRWASDSRLASQPAENAGWQLDGSNQSVASEKSALLERNTGLTMKDYEEQLSTLRKENFNLKLRIYFMEESRGQAYGSKEQETMYRINIDLKVQGEELKKEVEEKTALLAEAAQALGSLEARQAAKLTDLRQQLEREQADRQQALQDLRLLSEEHERCKAGQQQQQPLISEDSRLLYAEAFGSINMGNRCCGHAETTMNREAELEQQVLELTQLLRDRDSQIVELQQASGDIMVKPCAQDITVAGRPKTAVEQPGSELLEEADTEELLADSEEHVRHLEAELARLTSKEKEILLRRISLVREGDRTRDLEERNQQLEDKLIELDAHLTHTESRLAEAETQVSEVTIDRDRAETELADARASREAIQAELAEAQANYRHVLMDLQESKSNREKIQSGLDELRITCNEIRAELAASVTSREQVEAELRETRAKCEHVGDELAAERAASAASGRQLDAHTAKIRELNADLAQRNSEILSFVDLVRKLKKAFAPSSRRQPRNGDENACDEATPSPPASPESGVESAAAASSGEEMAQLVAESGAFVAELLQQQQQLLNSSDLRQHVAYAEERCAELEGVLSRYQQEAAEREARIGELEEQLERLDWERERSVQAQKAADLRSTALKAELKTTAESLTKAHLCIQGFVRENQRLVDQQEKGAQLPKDAAPPVARQHASTETENISYKDTASFVRAGVALARDKFRPALAHYRGRFERACANLADSRRTCQLLRQRMEQLADFLQQLLDGGDLNDTMNLSTLSLELRSCIQNSIDQSRHLSASILQQQSRSVLSQTGLIEDEAEAEAEEEDEVEEAWVVPDVSIQEHADDLILDGNPQEESAVLGRCGGEAKIITQTEYESLLLDLRDNLRLRREAEEGLDLARKELAALKKKQSVLEEDQPPHDIRQSPSVVEQADSIQKASRLPVSTSCFKMPQPFKAQHRGRQHQQADQHREEEPPKRSRSLTLQLDSTPSHSETHQRRRTITRIPGPPRYRRTGDEEDEWSEPDKEESRRRMGLAERQEGAESGDDSESAFAAGGQSRPGGRARRERLEADLARLESRNQELMAEKVMLELDAKKLRSELTAAQTRVRQKEAELEDVRSSCSDTAGQEENQNMINELEQRLKGQAQALTILKTRLTQAESRRHSFETAAVREREEMQKGLEEARKNLDEALMDQKEARKREEEAGRNLAAARKREEEVEKRLEAVTQVLDETKRCLEKALIGREEARKEMEVAKRGEEVAKSKEEDAHAREVIVTKRLEEVKKEHDKTSKRLDLVVKETEEARKLVAHWRDKEKEMRRLAETATREKAALQLEADRLRVDQQGSEEEKRQLTAQICQLKAVKKSSDCASCSELRSKIRELQREADMKSNLSRQSKSSEVLHEAVHVIQRHSSSLSSHMGAGTEKAVRQSRSGAIVTGKENVDGRSLSGQELELASNKRSLSQSGPSRKVLGNIDTNSQVSVGRAGKSGSSQPGEPWSSFTALPQIKLGHLPGQCCDARDKVQRLIEERDAALAHRDSAQAALRAATDRLEQADRRKRKWERAICHQLTETRAVLRQTKNNLESCSGSEGSHSPAQDHLN